jgi:hypothetical protein
MELLLNLAWLLLALPACWLWYGREHAPARRFSPFQLLLALGCMLVVLFPVISATDDLCAMRAELEESPAGKHSIRQSSHERLSACKWQTQPAVLSNSRSTPLKDYAWLTQPTLRSFPKAAHTDLRSGRAPPCDILS